MNDIQIILLLINVVVWIVFGVWARGSFKKFCEEEDARARFDKIRAKRVYTSPSEL